MKKFKKQRASVEFEYEFEDGEVYTYTPNHKLLVLRNNESVWVMAGELTEEDEVLTHEMVNVTK